MRPMTLTPWFSLDTTPTRRGFYDTRVPSNAFIRVHNHLGGLKNEPRKPIEIRLYWDGRFWLASRNSPQYTADLFRQRREWRGVFSHAKT